MISRLAEKSLDAHIEREATITVDAPAGALGILLTGEIKPIVEGLKDESPLHLDVGVGWQLKSINGTSVAALGCEKAAEVLAKQESLPRQLIFFDPERKRAATCGEPMEPPRPYGTIVVEAPAGRLGLKLKTNNEGCAIVTGVRPAAPLARKVAVGWRLLKVDEVDVSSLGHDGAVKVLGERASRSRRCLTFDGGEQPTVFGGVMGDLLKVATYGAVAAVVAGSVYYFAPPELLNWMKKEVMEGMQRMRETMHGHGSQWNETEGE